MTASTANPPPGSTGQTPYRILLDEVGAFVYTTDLSGRYTYANRLVLDLLGPSLQLEDVLGKSFTDFVDIGEHGAELRQSDRSVLDDGQTIAREETNFIHATGEWRTYWSIKKPLRDATGAITGLIGISHDITAKKRLEDAVREQKKLLDTILDNIDALVYMKGADRRFLYANQPAARVFGQPAEHIVGRLDSELMPSAVADRFWAQDQKILASGKRHVSEETFVDAAGRRRHYWSVIVPWTSPEGSPALIGLSTDITELHALKEELERQARADSLTGLANRRHFFERAAAEFARCREHGLPLSLIAIDLDHFKQINDVHGHPIGDLALAHFAACCRKAVRATDLCARTGGEEFCVLLPEVGGDDACATAERIRTLPCDLHTAGLPADLRLTASLGLVGMAPDDHDFDALFRRADRALYAAKAQGRNRIVRLPPVA